MKTRPMIVWLAAALLAVVTVARAQDDPAAVYTGPAGIPGTPTAPSVPSGAVNVFTALAYELTVTPIEVGAGMYSATSTIPGDVVLLADPAGGDAPSNWAAVAQFFNPNDPTGSQGLLAIETEGFFAQDFGANGFASFSLLPNVYYTSASSVDEASTTAFYVQFGPAGAIPTGQLDETNLLIEVPEPGALGMLAAGLAGLAVVRFGRRKENK